MKLAHTVMVKAFVLAAFIFSSDALADDGYHMAAATEPKNVIISDVLVFGGIETIEVEGEDPFEIDVPVSEGVACKPEHRSCESYSEVTR